MKSMVRPIDSERDKYSTWGLNEFEQKRIPNSFVSLPSACFRILNQGSAQITIN